ncbi:GtrA family protein [Pseudoalteromonas shioyasakiensis]|uniref:GtrA family protein n=1 Tax=Pseudoalteromonas shioyasakiensis TaxID=1190813 RepID=UPI002119583D|nr:GtrA family protein [Pseudoalteromonas shioyasakiensis]MCQ8879482.1 GtrA family protein [Pseudoalteromonas shioyasakiensis]
MTKSMLYVAFAIIATIVNLFTQEITSNLFHHHQYEIVVSMFIGTLAGLIVKYLLDKRFIFKFETKSQQQSFTTFLLYSLMGIITTLLFWITEYTFDIWFETKTMRYVGAVIGLSLGYVAKYYLDKKYVFIER